MGKNQNHHIARIIFFVLGQFQEWHRGLVTRKQPKKRGIYSSLFFERSIFQAGLSSFSRSLGPRPAISSHDPGVELLALNDFQQLNFIFVAINKTLIKDPLTGYQINLSKFMKRNSLLILLSLLIFSSCKKKSEEHITIPVIHTSAINNITTSKASSGGSVSSDGGSVITVAGMCWSKTNSTPSISDNKAVATVTSGSFSVELTGLESNTTYYVRAYATNSEGTGYGLVISFSTAPNLGPVASAPSISGIHKTNAILTLAYVYSDPENDPEGASTFQWYRANTPTGAGETAITGATEEIYVVQEADLGKYISAGVTPKATSGLATGNKVKCAYTGVIGVGTDVTFTYNGKLVTYGILTSERTGKKWLDRNLGAPNVPVDETDFANFGDLFQWGRAADGHQTVSWTSQFEDIGIGVNGRTSIAEPFAYSNTDDPGTSKFIFVPYDVEPMDWRMPQNNNLWQLPVNKNNPCPAGWHVPTADEFKAEGFTSIYDGFEKLKITASGARQTVGAFVYGAIYKSRYWTSTAAEDQQKKTTQAYAFEFLQYSTTATSNARASGFPVRCIRN
jgi:uncharacterized protein (TIGR02145 family)